mgnify:CR=1 FL=1
MVFTILRFTAKYQRFIALVKVNIHTVNHSAYYFQSYTLVYKKAIHKISPYICNMCILILVMIITTTTIHILTNTINK